MLGMTTGIGEDRGELVAPKKAQIPADTFAHRLMLVRAHAGYMTVKDAAERAGLNYGSWSNWERGSMPRDLLDVVQKISDALDIDYDWLLFGDRRSGRQTLRGLYPPTTKRRANPKPSTDRPRAGRPPRPRIHKLPVAA